MTPLCPEQTITTLEATGRCQGPGKESRAPAGSTDAGRGLFPPEQSCSPSCLLEPSRAGQAARPPRTEHCSPTRPRGCEPHSVTSRKSSEASHQGWEDPPPPGSASGAAPDALPTPLAEVQGGFFPLVEPENLQGACPADEVWVPGALQASVEVTLRAGPGEGVASVPGELRIRC